MNKGKTLIYMGVGAVLLSSSYSVRILHNIQNAKERAIKDRIILLVSVVAFSSLSASYGIRIMHKLMKEFPENESK